jgi:hypothetical protein
VGGAGGGGRLSSVVEAQNEDSRLDTLAKMSPFGAMQLDKEYAKYFKMMKFKVPLKGVCTKMRVDGVHQGMITVFGEGHGAPPSIWDTTHHATTSAPTSDTLSSGVNTSQAIVETSAGDAGTNRDASDIGGYVPGISLKRFHWDPLPLATQDQVTVWSSHSNTLREVVPVKIEAADALELARLFGTAEQQPRSRKNVGGGGVKGTLGSEKGAGGESKAGSSGLKKKEMSLLDSRRSMNINIGLSQFRCFDSPTDVASALVLADTKLLPLSKLHALLEMMPTEAETKTLLRYHEQQQKQLSRQRRQHNGEGPLNKADQFMLAMALVTRPQRKVQALILREQFDERLHGLRSKARMLIASCNRIVHSPELARAFEVILALTRYMNRDHKGSATQGISLKSVINLSRTKSTTDGKTSLLDYMVKMCINRGENVLDITDTVQLSVGTLALSNQILSTEFKTMGREVLQVEREYALQRLESREKVVVDTGTADDTIEDTSNALANVVANVVVVVGEGSNKEGNEERHKEVEDTLDTKDKEKHVGMAKEDVVNVVGESAPTNKSTEPIPTDTPPADPSADAPAEEPSAAELEAMASAPVTLLSEVVASPMHVPVQLRPKTPSLQTPSLLRVLRGDEPTPFAVDAYGSRRSSSSSSSSSTLAIGTCGDGGTTDATRYTESPRQRSMIETDEQSTPQRSKARRKTLTSVSELFDTAEIRGAREAVKQVEEVGNIAETEKQEGEATDAGRVVTSGEEARADRESNTDSDKGSGEAEEEEVRAAASIEWGANWAADETRIAGTSPAPLLKIDSSSWDVTPDNSPEADRGRGRMKNVAKLAKGVLCDMTNSPKIASLLKGKHTAVQKTGLKRQHSVRSVQHTATTLLLFQITTGNATTSLPFESTAPFQLPQKAKRTNIRRVRSMLRIAPKKSRLIPEDADLGDAHACDEPTPTVQMTEKRNRMLQELCAQNGLSSSGPAEELVVRFTSGLHWTMQKLEKKLDEMCASQPAHTDAGMQREKHEETGCTTDSVGSGGGEGSDSGEGHNAMLAAIRNRDVGGKLSVGTEGQNAMLAAIRNRGASAGQESEGAGGGNALLASIRNRGNIPTASRPAPAGGGRGALLAAIANSKKGSTGGSTGGRNTLHASIQQGNGRAKTSTAGTSGLPKAPSVGAVQGFGRALKQFVRGAKGELNQLSFVVEEMEEAFAELSHYFGMEPSETSSDEIFSLLDQFLKALEHSKVKARKSSSRRSDAGAAPRLCRQPSRGSIGDKVLSRFGCAVVCSTGTAPPNPTVAAGNKGQASTSYSLDLGWGRAYVRDAASFIGESGSPCSTPYGNGVLASGAVNAAGFCKVQLPWGIAVVQAPEVRMRN